MRSKKSISKLFGSGFYAVLFLSALFIIPHKTSLALPSLESMYDELSQSADRICNPTLYQFITIAEDQPQQSIVRFGYNYDTVRYLKTLYNVFGISIDNVVRCATMPPPIGFSVLGTLCEAATGALANPGNCEHFMLGYDAPSGGFADSPVSGSLIGLYYTAERMQKSSVPPLDVKYFASKQFEKVPYLGTALAAESYTTPFVNDIYRAWVIVRNLALSVFSLIVLGVGIMMINRSRVNPQTVVTIQYALPKIILSLIFIIFSYPIGAVMCTFFYRMVGILDNIIYYQGYTMLNESIIRDFFVLDSSGEPTFSFGKFGAYIFVATFFRGLGIFPILLALVILLVALCQVLIIIVKYFILYIKMLFEVLMAPASMAIYAIPGNDTKLMDWFKKMAAYGISMMVLGAGPHLVLVIALMAGYDSSNFSPSGPSWGDSITSFGGLTIIMTVLIIFVGLGLILKMPDKIIEAITGQRKR